MKQPRILLAILIIVGGIFAVAFWSNIVKLPLVPPQIKTSSDPIEIIEVPDDCELTLEGCKG